VAGLARVGIGVYALGSTTPEQPVRAPASPMRLTTQQAQTEAAGALTDSGISGAQLDTAVVGRPLTTNAPPIPTAALILAWAHSGTPAATLAARILGPVGVSDYASAIRPLC
jgi:hypothetical protein